MSSKNFGELNNEISYIASICKCEREYFFCLFVNILLTVYRLLGGERKEPGIYRSHAHVP